MIFEFLLCRYCLVHHFTHSSVVELIEYMTMDDDGQPTSTTLRPAQKMLAETYTIIRRSNRCIVIRFEDVFRTEQIAWIGILGNRDASTFGVHNRFVNSCMLSSREER